LLKRINKLVLLPTGSDATDLPLLPVQNETVYSPTPNLSEVDGYYTYCVDCAKPTKKIQLKDKKSEKLRHCSDQRN
jgi:hypothetical protein